MISATISGVSVSVGNASFTLEDPLEARAILTFTVLDSTGTASYQRGQPVTFSDPGIISYSGYVQSDTPMKEGIILPYVEHVIVCMDGEYNLDKRSNTTNYLNWVAGNIAVDFVRTTLVDEGITVAASMHRDTTASDFNAGNLSGTTGATNANVSITNGLAQTLSTTDDGDLELTLAGGTVTISESTTADFSTGTLTNVTSASNTLTPTTVSAIQFSAQLPIPLSTSFLYMKIWSGSMTVGTLDTLNYDIWISSTSPAFNGGVDLNFSDGSSLHTYSGPVDQNFLAATPTTDLSGFAKDTWYTRTIALGSALNGKTITSVCVAVAGVSTGTYALYFKNIYLGSQSGSPFFSTSATATQVNPPTLFSVEGYPSSLALISVVNAIPGPTAFRVSPPHSIDAVKLINTTFISWDAVTPSGSTFQMAVSYDGNTFLLCTNGQPLPGLPAGSNVAGLSLYLQEIFATGTSPVALPILNSASVTLNPAPNATKSDISTNYGTSTAWNAGTALGLSVNANGDLTLGALSRNWNDGLILGQTFFPTGAASEAVTSGKYTQTVSSSTAAMSRFDFAGVATNFVAEWDMVLTASGAGAWAFLWRKTDWSGLTNGGWTLLINLSPGQINVYYNGAGVDALSFTFTSGTSYHFKLIVQDHLHQILINGSTVISTTDTNPIAPGNIGVATVPSGGSGATGSIDNLTLTASEIGTWTSASASLAALTTIAGSTISWLETLATGAASSTALVQTSIDGGTTWQLCTNNATIPGLTAGVNVSSKSLLVKITLFSQTVVGQPVIGGLNWRALGAFPTVTGTRDTAPMGNDTQITRTVGSGWGTAFDGQAWTQTGTGTTAVGSGEATISNTTGTVYMRLGTRTSADMDGTFRFSLSSSAETAGIFLRFVDTNNYYALAATTSGVSLLKRLSGVTTTLKSVSMALSINTEYRMRGRVAGSSPVALFGNVWADGTREPTATALGYWDDSQWVITASD